MAARYLAAGYTVYGEARDQSGAQWLIDQGLRWVETPREVAEAADIVMTSLPNDQVVESVAGGPDGLITGLGAVPGRQTAGFCQPAEGSVPAIRPAPRGPSGHADPDSTEHFTTSPEHRLVSTGAPDSYITVPPRATAQGCEHSAADQKRIRNFLGPFHGSVGP
jgi:6-phosphogluconate dehydrogenase-like protein